MRDRVGGEAPLCGVVADQPGGGVQPGGRKLDRQPVRVPGGGGAEHDRHLRAGVIGAAAGQRDRDVERRAAGVRPDPAAGAGGEAADSRVGALVRSITVAAACGDRWAGRALGGPGGVARRSTSQRVSAPAASWPGPGQQPVAGHPLRQRGGHHGACLVGVVPDECQVHQQGVGVDELPPVREQGDVPVGQRCPRADRDPRQPRVDPRAGTAAGRTGRRGTDGVPASVSR